MLKNVLQGTGVAIITPFSSDLSVDYNALEKLINYIIDGGVNYIVSLGTTGETPVLSTEEKVSIANFTAEKINGRVPLVIGCGGNYTKAVVEDLKNLPLQHAVAVLSASPYYNKPSQEGIYNHYVEIAKASPVPVILYNVPGRTGRNMSAALTVKLSRVANIAGIKEASGDMVQVMEILRDVPKDFLVISGDDALALPQMACGMDGVISVAANSFPNEFSEMIRSCRNGDYVAAKKINDSLMDAYTLMFSENNPAGVKAFLSCMDIISNELRLPGMPVQQELMDAIRKNVTTWKKTLVSG